jgi:hypothetical protein
VSGIVQPGTPRRSRRSAPVEPRDDNETYASDAQEATGDEPVISAAALGESVGRAILEQVNERPYTSVLVAVGAGYVLGVGTPTWVTKLAWTIASRLAVSKIVGALE